MNVRQSGGGYYSTSSDYESRLRHSSKQVEELEQQLRQRVRENHVKSPNQIRIDFGKPYVKILELCEGLMASTLIMASHSHTMAGRLIMVSNTDYLLHMRTAACIFLKTTHWITTDPIRIDFLNHNLTTKIISKGNPSYESGA